VKRFTETEKWKDPWFRVLSPAQKCLWMYLCDNCDHAGVIEPDFGLVSFQIGAKVSEKDMEALGDRVLLMDNSKYWVRAFVRFQYGKLSEACKPHAPVLAAIARHGIDMDDFYKNERLSKGIDRLPDTLSKAFDRLPGTLSKGIQETPKGYQSLQEEEKDKDKETDKETETDRDSSLPFKSQEFCDAWGNWVSHRKEIKKPLTPQSVKQQLAEMSTWGEQRAIAAIRHTIGKGWQGLAEPDTRAAQINDDNAGVLYAGMKMSQLRAMGVA